MTLVTHEGHRASAAQLFRSSAQPKGGICVLCTRLVLLCLALAAPLVVGSATAGLPAFPGAYGGGASSVGGRGGQVLHVITLEDYYPGSESVIRGSFRWAVEEVKGPRTVVFRVGGTIELKRDIVVNDSRSYITIAGQTAPGGGIQLSGEKMIGWESDPCKGNQPLVISNAQHVIIRFLRIRKGVAATACPGNPNALSVTGTSKHIMLDHLSLFWGEDQIFNINGFSSSDPVSNVTLQNSILAEPILRGASAATTMLMHANDAQTRTKLTDIDLIRNYLVNSTHRNPASDIETGRFINNIMYNGMIGGIFRSGTKQDIVGNIFKMGPVGLSSGRQYDIGTYGPGDWDNHDKNINADPSLYVKGNKGRWYVTDPDADNWPLVRHLCENGPNGGPCGVAPTGWRRNTPLPDPQSGPVDVWHVDELEDLVLAQVGASRRIDCDGKWVSSRDSQDKRVVEQYFSGGGTLIEHQKEVGGFPKLEAGTPCVDTSGDGIPDEWAQDSGLDHTDPSLGTTVHSSGYTYLELYLSGMQLGIAPAVAPTNVRIE